MKSDTKRDKKIVIVITIIVSIIIVCGISKVLLTKKENKEIIKEVKKDKTFAIMIQNGDTYKEYTSKDNKWPDNNYIFSKAECVDNTGNRVEDAITFNNETRKATLKSKKTIYCTLYFDESNIIKLRENEKLLNKDNLSSDLQGGMYRYQGTDNVANWICFGTEDNCGANDDLIDKYMYRIIGITPNGELYLLKETFIKEGEITGFVWNDKYSADNSTSHYCVNGLCPEWGQNTLFKRLNGTSNGETRGTGSFTDNANTDIFIDSEYYDYLKSGDSINGTKDDKGSKWYQLIINHEWMYGDIGEHLYNYNGQTLYEIETGQAEVKHYVGIDGNITEETYTWNQNVTAKISLMYIHDYLYSYPGGNPGNNSIAKNGWIFFQKDGYNSSPSYDWLNIRWGIFSTSNTGVDAQCVSSGGNVVNTFLGNQYGVRPVFYLTSDIEIYGEGTKEKPFMIKI